MYLLACLNIIYTENARIVNLVGTWEVEFHPPFAVYSFYTFLGLGGHETHGNDPEYLSNQLRKRNRMYHVCRSQQSLQQSSTTVGSVESRESTPNYFHITLILVVLALTTPLYADCMYVRE